MPTLLCSVCNDNLALATDNGGMPCPVCSPAEYLQWMESMTDLAQRDEELAADVDAAA